MASYKHELTAQRTERPARTFVLPVPLSRMLAAYTLIRESEPNIGTKICIPVTNAIESLNRVIRKSIKTKTVLPCAEAVPMLLRALLASGQIQMRKVDGRETLAQPIEPMPLDLAA